MYNCTVKVEKKSERRKETNIQNINFEKGQFVAPFLVGLGLLATSKARNETCK
jgi:hypothetical protein